MSQDVWNYNVGGMAVIRHWFNYRSAGQRYRRRSSSPDFTDELLEMLTVLDRLVALAPQQADLLQRICRGSLISTSALTAAAVLPVPRHAHRLPSGTGTPPPTLF